LHQFEDAENRVFQIFLDEFSNEDFYKWNVDLEDQYSQGIVKNVGRASRINVKSFIKDLW